LDTWLGIKSKDNSQTDCSKNDWEVSMNNPMFHDSAALSQKLIDILDFESHQENIDKLPLRMLQSIMMRVYKNKLLDK